MICRKPQHKKCHSTAISIGQLVEIQTAFVAAPRGKGKYKMVCKARAVCILDKSIETVSSDVEVKYMLLMISTQDINNERVQLALRSTSPMRKLKRNIGYDDDSEVEEARQDVKRMRVDEDCSQS